MHISQLSESKYLKKEDVGEGVIATIQSLEEVNIAMDNEPDEMVTIVWFQELEKPLILKPINAQLIAVIVGSEETNDWPGKTIELYHDRMVTFGKKVIGGIRARPPGGGGFAHAQQRGHQQPQQHAPQRGGGMQHPSGGMQRPQGRQLSRGEGEQSPFSGPAQPAQGFYKPPPNIPQDDDEGGGSDNDGNL